ncbi:MAG: DNA mismatch repair endonuclease MutL [Bacteroidaceae bacterium]|nr:DNA mismatch repair endonuclease MutL [Bacteroidaceae bacterium]
MSDIIQLLPDAVANQIAAGEVIQRPSSVIKELMENSVDAGATSIDVLVSDAGKTHIQVVDNGKGMSETDARLSFERHATSKIRQASDLFSLHTMGFRGEALPSIAAVSQLELKTRTKDEDLGVWLTLEASKIVDQKPIACGVGANFSVKNLFYNVPARRRFLKSNPTELSNIMSEFERVALIHPEISFTFHRDDALVLDLRPSSFRKRIINLFGTHLDKQLLPVHVETPLVTIDGFVGVPSSARTKGAKQFFFVNKRYMRHPYFNRAIMTAFERLIPSDKQVPYFYCIDVDPSRIDVNIHPTKTEIKFQDDQAIWQIMLAATKETLGKFNEVPTIDFTETEMPEIPIYNPAQGTNIPLPHVEVDRHYDPFRASKKGTASSFTTDKWEDLYATIKKTTSTAVPLARPNEGVTPEEGEQLPLSDHSDWEATRAGYYQHQERYILTSVKSGLMVVDQYRAHVRILYDRYLRQFTNGETVSQRLLFPELIQIPVSQAPQFSDALPEMEHLGFEVSNLGGGSYAINGVPSGVDDQHPSDLVNEIVEVIINKEGLPKEKVYHRVALALARRNAIRVGTHLSGEEMKNLIDELFMCAAPNFTPDGRNVVVILQNERLDALFR